MSGQLKEDSEIEALPNFIDRLSRLLSATEPPVHIPRQAPELQPATSIVPADYSVSADETVSEVTSSDGPDAVCPLLLANEYENSQAQGYADVSVRDYILDHDCSVRLRNRVVSEDVFLEWSMYAATRRLEEFKAVALAINGLGRKSVDELIRFVEQSDLVSYSKRQEESEIVVGAELLSPNYVALDDDARRLPLSFVLAFTDCSTRLRNALSASDIENLSLDDYIRDPESLISRLRDQRGVGLRTLKEATFKIDDLVDRIVAKDPIVLAFADECLGKEDATRFYDQQALVGTSSDKGIIEQFDELISSLPEREGYVVARRYGLGGMRGHTLEEIALGVHVTRERVRQLEARAIRRLSVASSRHILLELLRQSREEIWNTLSGGNALVTEIELRENRSRLDGRCWLAIDIAYSGISEWLSTCSDRIASGWLRKGENFEELERLTDRLDRLASDRPIPMAIAASILDIDMPSLELCCEHSSRVSQFESYLCGGRVGPKVKRTVRLHRIAVELNPSGLFDIATLTAAYRKEFAEDAVAPRMFQMQMEEAPHLFCRVLDNIWFALAAREDTQPKIRLPHEREALLEPVFETASIGARLVEQLSEGPKRHTDLRSMVGNLFEDRIADSSVGAILAANPCFRRVAPGIFDLYRSGHVYDEHGVLDVLFLDERQCRSFCQARYGGAPVDWYPAWGSSFELWITRWAKLRAGSELFRSLLFVVDPLTWSAPNDEIDYWMRTKERESSWLIGSARRTRLGRRFLEPDQFIATLAHLAIFGWTSWVAVNRTTDARGDVHDAADVLAQLVMADLAVAPDDWQKPHIATERADHIFRRAIEELHSTGELGWDRGVLGDVWESIEENAKYGASGWIDSSEFISALESWKAGDVRVSRAFAKRSGEPIDPDPIFLTEDWESLFGRS